MLKQHKTIGLVAISLALVLVLVVSGCGPAAPAEKERVVKVGAQWCLTGPFASLAVTLAPGATDYIRWLNEHGGLDGVGIDISWVDNQGMVPRAVLGHKRLKDAGVVMELLAMSSCTEAVAPMAAKDEIPIINNADFTPLFITKPKQWVFSFAASYASSSTTFVKWFKDNWTQERVPRVGAVIMDYASGWDALNGIKDYADEIGIEFIGKEVVPLVGCIDTSTELLRLAAKKPDCMYCATAGATFVTLIKDAARLKLQEKGIMLASYPTITNATIAATGADHEGWYVVIYCPGPYETELPGMASVLEAAKKYRGWDPDDFDWVYVMGWIWAKVTLEGVRLAIDKVGLENVSGPAVRDALASINDFETGLLPPITTSERQPFFTRYDRVYQVQQGKIMPVSDWLEDYVLLPKFD